MTYNGEALPLSSDPVWLEPSQEGTPLHYDRYKPKQVFWQFLPSAEDHAWKERFEIALGQLISLREPLAFEMLGNKNLFQCQFVLQHVDASLLGSAVFSAFRYSHIVKQDSDPIYLGFRAVKDSGLRREYHFLDYHSNPPIYLPVFNTQAADKANSLDYAHSAFVELEDTELGFFQLLFLPCKLPWGQIAQLALNQYLLGNPDQRRLRAQADERVMPATTYYSVCLRIGGFVGKAHLDSFIRKAHSIFRSLAFGSNRLVCLTRRDYYRAGLPRRDHFYLLFNRVTFRPGILLTHKELAALFPAFLASSLEGIPELVQARKSYPVPTYRNATGPVLGINLHQGKRTAVRIGAHLPNEHLYIVGKSGYGKTTLMENLIAQHIEAGDGFGIVDPHGDLIGRVLRLIPENRIAHTVHFNPADPDYLIPLNVLANEGTQQEKEHLRADLEDFFEELNGEKLGVNIQHFLNHCLPSLLSKKDSTLADIKTLLFDKQFRDEFVGSLRDPALTEFWVKEYPLWAKGSNHLTITNKLSPLLLPGGFLRPLLSSRSNTLDFRSMLDNSGIFLCSIPKGELTERNTRLIGRLIISRLSVAAMMRGLSTPPKPWYFYVDEVQDVASRSLVDILNGGRKFGLHLRINNQSRQDLPEKLRVAVGNAATTACFVMDNVSEQAETEKFLGRKFSAAEIGALPKGEALVKMDGHVFNLSIEQRTQAKPELASRVIEYSRQKYATRIAKQETTRGGETMTPKTIREPVRKEHIQEAYDEL